LSAIFDKIQRKRSSFRYAIPDEPYVEFDLMLSKCLSQCQGGKESTPHSRAKRQASAHDIPRSDIKQQIKDASSSP
jgi:hypothetical protein